MQTKLSRTCDMIIEAGWLAALIVTPLFFNTLSNRVFEPDKLHLLRSIALVMAAAWAAQLLDALPSARGGVAAWWARLRSTPLVLPALILVAAYIISTLTSVTPRISFFGSYVRLQGTFTYLSYVAIFAMVLTHLRTRSQVNRLIHAVVLTSLPISIYGIIQHYNLDPLPWAGNVTDRVAGNMGNAIFVAAYLIMAFFLTLERFLDSVLSLLSQEKGSTADALRAGAYLFVLVLQAITIIFTQSRGPWLGWAGALYVFLMMGVLLLARWAVGRPRAPHWLSRAVRPVWLSLIGLTLVGLGVVIVLNMPKGPLAGLCRQRYVARVCSLFSLTEGTNAVRVLIWEGVVDMMLKPHPPIEYPDGTPDRLNAIRPLVGYGPESLWVAYNRFYPPDLAHYEARNASPDRSHNETLDVLARSGFLGFGAQLFLFGSVFYYALHWLGLMQGRARRSLFLGFMVGGALLGVLLPLILDGSARLAGVGLPAGLMAGVILYVTVDLLLAAGAKRQAARPAVDGPAELEQASGASSSLGSRRQLLILALFSAIVAHFVEVHFGIAIASTLTHFWILSAALVAVGMGWVGQADWGELGQPAEAPVPVSSLVREKEPRLASRALPAAEAAGRGAALAPAHRAAPAASRNGGRPGTETTASHRAKGEAAAGERPAAARLREARTTRPAAVELGVGQRAHSPIIMALPYAGIGALVTLVLTSDYLINQTGATNLFAILWNAFTVRVSATTFQVIQSPMLLVMLLFTWVVGGVLALGESLDQLRSFVTSGRSPAAAGRGDGTVRTWGMGLALYFGVVVGVWLIFGLYQAGRTVMTGLGGLDVFRRMAGHIAVFDLILLVFGLALAAALWAADTRPRPLRAFRASPVLPVAGGIVAAVVALAIVVTVNVETVQADTYYKQGLSYEAAGQWEGAVVLYREAALLEPQEDFYYLFLGRGLLQLASAIPAGTPTLPVDLTQTATGDLLSVVESGIRARNREDLLRASYAALTAAQRLNPLNTDHSANLARLSRSWAFATGALGPNDSPTNAVLRQIVATRPKDVDMDRLNRSLSYYRQATSLSPQNAQLWNEMAQVQFILGDLPAAISTLDHSLSLDQQFQSTYLVRGDLLSASGDSKGALQAYLQALAFTPSDASVLSAVGVLSVQAGDAEGALVAFRSIIESATRELTSAQRQLAEHDALVGRLGGYSQLLPSAASRRDGLQGAISSYRNQLHLAYRNTALVLRDTGRLPQALEAARSALTFASDADRATTEALIADIQKRGGG